METEEIINKKWKVIYPVYIDSEFPKSKGRRLGINNSIKNPLIEEIKVTLDFLLIPNAIESYKKHPCNFFKFGRIRYKLKDENDNYYNPKITNSNLIRKTIIKISSKFN